MISMIIKSPKEDFNDGYYHFAKDLEDYPEAGCYAVWSRRGPGKTYSFLRYCIDNGIFFIYMKRTNDDVQVLIILILKLMQILLYRLTGTLVGI